MNSGLDIDWVIAGGESGKGFRPVEEDWLLALRDDCQEANVDFFFKQWGGHTPKAGGRQLDGSHFGTKSLRRQLIGDDF